MRCIPHVGSLADESSTAARCRGGTGGDGERTRDGNERTLEDYEWQRRPAANDGRAAKSRFVDKSESSGRAQSARGPDYIKGFGTVPARVGTADQAGRRVCRHAIAGLEDRRRRRQPSATGGSQGSSATGGT